MKKSFLIVGGVVIAIAAGAGGWYYYNNSQVQTSGKDTVYVSEIGTLMGNTLGIQNRYAGVVEPQDTVDVKIDNGRKVKEVKVKVGEEVKKGQLLFEYDLSSIQEDLQAARLDFERLKNEATNIADQIISLEKEKKQATADNQLSYTIEIETNKMNLKKNEYDQKKKASEIQKLENATANTEVRSDIDGVIQKIDNSKMNTEDSDSVEDVMVEETGSYMPGGESTENGAFITILSTGAYRVKGKVNELNRQSIIPGEPVIIRSRADETKTWKGTMGNVDQENASSDNKNNMFMGMMDSSGDEQTSSSSYPFYVQLETSEGLMLGQHVYIEPDQGQEDKKDGLWLSDFFIADADKEDPYVWVADDKMHLEKRSVTLGKYDENLFEYEIVDGLTMEDCIAFPSSKLKEGMSVKVGTSEQTMRSSMEEPSEEDMINEEIPEDQMGDMDSYEEGAESSEYDESGVDMNPDFSGDEDLVPAE